MHKTPIMLMCFGLLFIMLVTGCGDDDCPNCPDTVSALGHTQCALILTPGATLQPAMEVFANGAVAPGLDSVKVGDSLIEKSRWDLGGFIPYADAHWVISFYEGGDTSTFMYDHGDPATINVWGEGRSSSCQLKILEPPLAAANITDPLAQADTIVPGGADTIYWNTVEHVDYYAVMTAWLIYTPASTRYVFDYHYATDTSFIITDAIQPDDSILEFNVHITPFTGPDPRTGGSNWSGDLLDGYVYSYGIEDMTTIIVRSPTVSSEKAMPIPPADYRERNPDHVVANVYTKYMK